MAQDLSSKVKTKLHIDDKHKDKSKDDKKDKKDTAILSEILPGKDATSFKCALKKDCLLGTPKSAEPGTKKMEFKGKDYHEKCFCCRGCRTELSGKSFIPKDKDVYCTTCHEDKFATRCVKCSKVITDGGITYKKEAWHRECFTCNGCGSALEAKSFPTHEDKPYCNPCYDKNFATICSGCNKPISGNVKFLTFDDRHFHSDCFKCSKCKKSVAGKPCAKDGVNIICGDCTKRSK